MLMDWLRSISWRSTFPYLVVLAIVVGIALVLPHHEQYQAADSEPQYETAEQLPWGGMAEIAAAVFTGILALFAFVQVRDNRISNERQLRAYVSIDRAQISDINLVWPPVAEIKLRNFGQTPAYDLVHLSGIAFDVDPPPTGAFGEWPPMAGTKYIVGPGSESNKIMKIPEGEIATEAERQEIIAGTKALYVFGIVTYRDAFGKTRTTHYRLIQGGRVGIRGIHLMGCEEGNEAT
jgi:hypothetical protein